MLLRIPSFRLIVNIGYSVSFTIYVLQFFIRGAAEVELLAIDCKIFLWLEGCCLSRLYAYFLLTDGGVGGAVVKQYVPGVSRLVVKSFILQIVFSYIRTCLVVYDVGLVRIAGKLIVSLVAVLICLAEILGAAK